VKTIQTEKIIYNGEERIKLIFDYDKELNNKIRMLPDCRWSLTMGCWHISPEKESVDRLKNLTAGQYKLIHKYLVLHRPLA